jgi:hypothetical protein
MTRSKRFLLPTMLLPLATLVAACGSTTKTVTEDAGTAVGSYTIVFPAISVPVYADEIQVFVFPVGDGGTDCLDLLDLQEHGGTLPPTATDTTGKNISTQPISPCQLDSGGGVLSLPFGSYNLLVAVEKSGQDIAAGCAPQTISDSSPSMSVTVELLGTTGTIPSTQCKTIAAKCANTCN